MMNAETQTPRRSALGAVLAMAATTILFEAALFSSLGMSGLPCALATLRSAAMLVGIGSASLGVAGVLFGQDRALRRVAPIMALSLSLLGLDGVVFSKLAMHIPSLVRLVGRESSELFKVVRHSGVDLGAAGALGALAVAMPALIFAGLRRAFDAVAKALPAIGPRSLALVAVLTVTPTIVLAPVRGAAAYARPWLGGREGAALDTAIKVEGKVKKLLSEPEIGDRIENIAPPSHLPDVFLIIVESLRRDAISPSTAPVLAELASSAFSVDAGIAAANATHISWYSILTGNLPLRWETQFRSQASSGSVPMRIFKRLGYRLHLFSATDARYFRTDEIAFGKDHRLLSTYVDAAGSNASGDQRDSAMVEQVLHALDAPSRGGNMYVLFFDSTHFPYDFPSEEAAFSPFAPGLDFFQATYSDRDVTLIRNRYLNAVRHVDRLIGDLAARLRQLGAWDDSIIAVTGDHGEEFYEHRVFGHAIHNCPYQTQVPFIIKWSETIAAPKPRGPIKVAGHADLLPTILQATGAVVDYERMIDGKPLDQRRASVGVSLDVQNISHFYVAGSHGEAHFARESSLGERQAFSLRRMTGVPEKAPSAPLVTRLRSAMLPALREVFEDVTVEVDAAEGAEEAPEEAPVGEFATWRSRFRDGHPPRQEELAPGKIWNCRSVDESSAQEAKLFRFRGEIASLLENFGARQVRYYAVREDEVSGYSHAGETSYLRQGRRGELLEEWTVPTAAGETAGHVAISSGRSTVKAYSHCQLEP